MNDEEKRSLQLNYQILQENLKHLNKEINVLDQQLRMMQMLSANIEDIKGGKEGSEIFAEIGSGVFVKAALKGTSEMLVNVGANIMVSKPVDEAKNLIDEQVRQLAEAVSKTELELQNCALQLQIIQQQLLEEKNHKD